VLQTECCKQCVANSVLQKQRLGLCATEPGFDARHDAAEMGFGNRVVNAATIALAVEKLAALHQAKMF